MTFTYPWFDTTGRVNFEGILLPRYTGKPLKYLEIGCFEGAATCWILQNFPLAQVTVIDTFKGSEEHVYMHLNLTTLKETFLANIEPWKDRVMVLQGLSQYILRAMVGTYDVIYVDGSHEAADVLSDMMLSWSLLTSGGIMIMDDYEWHGFSEAYRCPKAGIDAFLAAFESQYNILVKGYQVVLQKL